MVIRAVQGEGEGHEGIAAAGIPGTPTLPLPGSAAGHEGQGNEGHEGHAMQQQDKQRGIAALCIGGGEATAVALERA